MKNQIINRKCPYYNWSYFRDFGARCEYHNCFFDSNIDCRDCVVTWEREIKEVEEI